MWEDDIKEDLTKMWCDNVNCFHALRQSDRMVLVIEVLGFISHKICWTSERLHGCIYSWFIFWHLQQLGLHNSEWRRNCYTVNWKWFGRRRSWTHVRSGLVLRLRGLVENTTHLGQDNRLPDRALNPELSNYEVGMPPIRHSPPFVQPGGSLPNSQEPAAGSCPVPAEFIPHRHCPSL